MNKTQSLPSLYSIIFAYLVVYIVWGSTFFFIEKLLHEFPPFVIGSIRFLVAGTILIVYCYLRGYKLYEKAQIKDALMVGFLLLFLDMAAVIWSEQYVSSGIVSIIAAATVIWFVLLDKPKWKENFSNLTTVLGLVMGFGGVFLIFAEQIFQAKDSSQEDESMVTIAMIVMILGTIAWTVGSLLSKYSKERAQRKHRLLKNASVQEVPELNIMVKTAWQMIVAGVAFTIVGSTNGDYAKFDYHNVTIEYWGYLVYLIFMGSILAFSSYIWLLQVRPATEVSTHAYINPIIALLLAHFFTEHEVTPLQIIGLVVVLLSVFLMNWNIYKNAHLFSKYSRRRKIKKMSDMAQKSSIPRIVEIFEFIKTRNKKNFRKRHRNRLSKDKDTL